jgi:hypothetical protein
LIVLGLVMLGLLLCVHVVEGMLGEPTNEDARDALSKGG